MGYIHHEQIPHRCWPRFNTSSTYGVGEELHFVKKSLCVYAFVFYSSVKQIHISGQGKEAINEEQGDRRD